MMILAFFAGLVLVTIIFGGSSQEKPKEEQPEKPAPAAAPANMPADMMVGLGEGYFVYRSPQDRFFLCGMRDGKLEVLDVYKLTHREPTYHAGVAEKSSHGWSFESLSQGREAVLEARSRQFEKAAASEDWAKTEKLAQEILAAGGIEFLKSWLDAGRNWGGRRAAALALAERFYAQTVPVLADMLLEGDEAREKAGSLLVKLTGEDFLKGLEGRNPDKAIRAYKDWYLKHQKEKEEKE
jgi:hypothetical protein